jgi:hypothetical protein
MYVCIIPSIQPFCYQYQLHHHIEDLYRNHNQHHDLHQNHHQATSTTSTTTTIRASSPSQSAATLLIEKSLQITLFR